MRIQFGLIAEGGSERPLIGILQELCRRAGASNVDGLWGNEVLARHEVGKDLTAQVQTLLAVHAELNLLFIHRDADSVDDSHVRGAIETQIRSLACPRAIAVVPVQETEAWLLTDIDALRRVVGNPRGTASLDVPKLKHIERRASPKELLRQALVMAAKPGRKQQDIRSNDKIFGQFRHILLEQLDIDGPVNQLSAWTKLVRDINEAVSQLADPTP